LPYCKICGRRIELSNTGVRVYKCRWCGKIVCRDDFDLVRNLCVECSGAKSKKAAVAGAH